MNYTSLLYGRTLKTNSERPHVVEQRGHIYSYLMQERASDICGATAEPGGLLRPQVDLDEPEPVHHEEHGAGPLREPLERDCSARDQAGGQASVEVSITICRLHALEPAGPSSGCAIVHTDTTLSLPSFVVARMRLLNGLGIVVMIVGSLITVACAASTCTARTTTPSRCWGPRRLPTSQRDPVPGCREGRDVWSSLGRSNVL
jgi:hypothetical protein